VAAAAAAGALVPSFLSSSSHREAPKISQDPTADNTDVYFFTSPEPDKQHTATAVANYIPFEEPAGGPNFFGFNDDVRYAINFDNTGDGKKDVSYVFRFKTKVVNPDTFLYATGPVSYNAGSGRYDNLNVAQTYSVQKITYKKNGRKVVRTLARNLVSPPNNVGSKTTPNYESLVTPAVHTLPDGTKVFAGQRDDPFFVDLGSVFDLVSFDPRPGQQSPFPGGTPEAQGKGDDGVTGYNVHTIAIQVPKKHITRKRNTPTDPNSTDSVVGVYATAERPAFTFPNGKAIPVWRQVSRLAQPLINEVVIPLGKKDRWNASDPSDDSQFAQHYLKPELGAALNALYPSVFTGPNKIKETDRTDLKAVLLTGLPPGNPFGLVTQIGSSPAHADLMRLNLAIPPTPPAQQNRLGVLAGQADGFPNGRRLVDDVYDIEVQAIAGVLLSPPNPVAGLLGDGVPDNDQPFLSSFPYVATPISGFDKKHSRPPTYQAP
jgi:hypothetical protein